MGRYKLTDDMIQEIETYAEDQYALKEIFIELNISKKLINDERILQAFEQGLERLYISLSSSGIDDVDIVDNYEITNAQCQLWKEKYSDEIKKGLQKKKDDEELATKQFSSPMHSGMINILEQNGKDMPQVSQQVLYDDIEKIINEVQNGNTKALIAMLTTNILQLQLFNGTVTRNIMGETGKQLDNFQKLSNIQLKVMQETRKSIMAINEITNPKRTTFIKEANQHNHLHQISEKKDESENELQRQLEKPDAIMDAALYVDKREENEKE